MIEDADDPKAQPMSHPNRPNLLYVVHRTPFPPDKGDRIRAFHLLRHLSRRAAVHLRDGSVVPRPGQAALVLSGGAEHRLAFVPATGSAELVVTLFPDGAPPPVRN